LFGRAEAALATTGGGFERGPVAWAAGTWVILRRTNGASVRQSPNAALPTDNSPSAEAGCATTAGTKISTPVPSAAAATAAIAAHNRPRERPLKLPLQSALVIGVTAMMGRAGAICASTSVGAPCL